MCRIRCVWYVQQPLPPPSAVWKHSGHVHGKQTGDSRRARSFLHATATMKAHQTLDVCMGALRSQAVLSSHYILGTIYWARLRVEGSNATVPDNRKYLQHTTAHNVLCLFCAPVAWRTHRCVPGQPRMCWELPMAERTLPMAKRTLPTSICSRPGWRRQTAPRAPLEEH